MGEASELHSQRLKTKNTRHWIALALVARIAPTSSSCKRPEPPPLATAAATGSFPGSTDSPSFPGYPERAARSPARLVPAARRVFVAVTRQLRFSPADPAPGPTPGPWRERLRCTLDAPEAPRPYGSPAGDQRRTGKPLPSKRRPGSPRLHARTLVGGGEGRDWRSPRWESESSYPSNPTLTPSPHQVLFIKTTGRPSLKGITWPSVGRRGFWRPDAAANKRLEPHRRFPLPLHPVPAPLSHPLPPQRRQAGGMGGRGAARLRREGGGAGRFHGNRAEARGAVGGVQVGMLRIGCANPEAGPPGSLAGP